MTITAVSLAQAPVTTGTTRTRQTPARPEVRFGDLLRAGGEVLAAGAEVALRALPGGPVLAAAVRGTVDAAGARASVARGGADPASPAGGSGSDDQGDLWDLTRQSQEFNLMYLQLQEEMSRENRRYTALSNVLKTRHETARAIIGNV